MRGDFEITTGQDVVLVGWEEYTSEWFPVKALRPVYEIRQRPLTAEERAEALARAELRLRQLESGAVRTDASYERDYSARRFVLRDRAARREFRDEYPDYKIKIRSRRMW